MRRLALTVVAVLAAIAGGAAGASVAGWLAWHTAAPLPSDAAARQIAGPDSSVYHRVDALFAFDPPLVTTKERVLIPVLGGDGYSAGNVELDVPAPNTVPSLTALHDRLEAAGWRLGPLRHEDNVTDGKEFDGSRTGLTIDAATSSDSNGPSLDIFVRRAQPVSFRWAVPLGGAFGAILGGLLLLRLFRTSARRKAILGLAGAGLVAMLPATLYTADSALASAFGPSSGDGAPDAPWVAFTWFVLRVPADFGFLLLIVALVVAVPRWGAGGFRRPPSSRPSLDNLRGWLGGAFSFMG